MEQVAKKRMLSGIKPSGDLTLGSYLGAVKNWAERAEEYDCFYFMADLHAITVRQNPADLRRRTLEQLAQYIACGLDPEKNTLFIQSHIHQHAELGWVLDCYSQFGELSRMTQFTDPDYWLILGKRVHASRLVILRDNLPPTLLRPAYNFLGIPMAQILWDYVMHWNRARVATSGILEKLNLLVFQTNTEDLLSQPQGVQQLDAKMLALSRYRDNDSVVVCDKAAEDIKNITLTISGVVDVVRQSLEFIAAINRTPAVKLLGISPSGFNATGESDIRNYYDHIMSKQELLHDGILRILRAVQLSVLGEIDQSINFEFNPLGTEDETGDIESASSRVNMLATLLQANVISADEARQAVKDDPKAKLGFLSDDAPEPNMGAMMPEMANQLQAAQEQQQSAPQEPQQAQGNASDVDLTGNPRAWMFQEPPHPKFEGREWMLGGRADATVTSAESEQA